MTGGHWGREGSAGQPVPLLVWRADPDEREALLSIGHPFFASRAGRDRIVVVLTDDTGDHPRLAELLAAPPSPAPTSPREATTGPPDRYRDIPARILSGLLAPPPPSA